MSEHRVKVESSGHVYIDGTEVYVYGLRMSVDAANPVPVIDVQLTAYDFEYEGDSEVSAVVVAPGGKEYRVSLGDVVAGITDHPGVR